MLIARCLILFCSSAQNNPARKSLNSSFCLEKSPLPSTKVPHLHKEHRMGLVLLFSNS